MSITFINARLDSDRVGTLRVQGSRIAAMDVAPNRRDIVMDLDGDHLLPGLINAHDHLQLNGLLPLEPPKIYSHAHHWVMDVDARRRLDPHFAGGVALPRNERLLQGALKNLLSGVTTVAHHDPLYSFLLLPDCPVSVVEHYGWSHSLYIDTEASVADSFRATPQDWPWIVHAAEGTNREAAHEFERLEALGCIQANSLLVHGIALCARQRNLLLAAGGGLIWCPSSNMRLFGKTADVSELVAHRRVALGTDSRLSGSRDLLEELKTARMHGVFEQRELESLVTDVPANLLRLSDRGSLKTGSRADLLVLPAGKSLGRAERRDVRLVMINGAPRFGDADCISRACPGGEWAAVSVDGEPKMLAGSICRQLAGASINEPGLDVSYAAGRAA